MLWWCDRLKHHCQCAISKAGTICKHLCQGRGGHHHCRKSHVGVIITTEDHMLGSSSLLKITCGGCHHYQRAHAGIIITPEENTLETFTKSKISEDIFSYCLCQDYGLASLFLGVRQEHPRHPLCISCCLDVSPLRVHILCAAVCIEGKPAAPRDRRKLPVFLWPPRGWWSKLELFPLKWKQRRPCDYSSVSQTPLVKHR